MITFDTVADLNNHDHDLDVILYFDREDEVVFSTNLAAVVSRIPYERLIVISNRSCNEISTMRMICESENLTVFAHHEIDLYFLIYLIYVKCFRPHGLISKESFQITSDSDQLSGPNFFGRPLVQREKEILDLVRQGWSNRAIATSLGVSVPTVKAHIFRMMRRLGLRSRVQLVLHIPRF